MYASPNLAGEMVISTGKFVAISMIAHHLDPSD